MQSMQCICQKASMNIMCTDTVPKSLSVSFKDARLNFNGSNNGAATQTSSPFPVVLPLNFIFYGTNINSI